MNHQSSEYLIPNPYIKKIYYVRVEKTCYAYVNVEAENEEKARELAENLKNNFVLDWK